MEVEDQLGSETAKCAEVIKLRVAPLNEKISEQRRSIEKHLKEISEFKKQEREQANELKFKDEQVAFFKKENGRKTDEKNELSKQIKSLKEDLGSLRKSEE